MGHSNIQSMAVIKGAKVCYCDHSVEKTVVVRSSPFVPSEHLLSRVDGVFFALLQRQTLEGLPLICLACLCVCVCVCVSVCLRRPLAPTSSAIHSISLRVLASRLLRSTRSSSISSRTKCIRLGFFSDALMPSTCCPSKDARDVPFVKRSPLLLRRRRRLTSRREISR